MFGRGSDSKYLHDILSYLDDESLMQLALHNSVAANLTPPSKFELDRETILDLKEEQNKGVRAADYIHEQFRSMDRTQYDAYFLAQIAEDIKATFATLDSEQSVEGFLSKFNQSLINSGSNRFVKDISEIQIKLLGIIHGKMRETDEFQHNEEFKKIYFSSLKHFKNFGFFSGSELQDGKYITELFSSIRKNMG